MIKIWGLYGSFQHEYYKYYKYWHLYMCDNRYLVCIVDVDASPECWLCTIPEKPELVSIINKLGDRLPWLVDPNPGTNRETVFNRVYEEILSKMRSAEHQSNEARSNEVRSNKVWIKWPYLSLT